MKAKTLNYDFMAHEIRNRTNWSKNITPPQFCGGVTNIYQHLVDKGIDMWKVVSITLMCKTKNCFSCLSDENDQQWFDTIDYTMHI